MRSFDFPRVESSTFPNGLKLKVAQMSRMPLVSLFVALDAGEAPLSHASAGLAVLSGEGLEGGTSERSGPELAEALEAIGTSLSVHTSWNATTVSVSCLAERVAEAGRLLAEALLKPAFPESEIDRLRSQRLAAIRQRRMNPGTLAEDAAAHFTYAESSPFHRPLAGTLGSVDGLGPEDINGFVAERFEPSGASLIVAGDVETSEMQSLGFDLFGGWRAAPPPGSSVDTSARYSSRRVVVVHRPGSVQSEVRIGQVGLPRSTPHYFPLRVFNTVLGGAFTSRLMLNLREKRGFTYGVRSRFSFRKAAGPFVISTAVDTDVTAGAVKEAIGEVEALLRDGPSEAEVDRARDFIAGVFPLQLETTGQVASRLTELHVFGLDDDFFSTYRDQIRAVTPEAALEAARASLDPGAMVVVVVGDADRVQKPLSDLGLGPVEVVNEF